MSEVLIRLKSNSGRAGVCRGCQQPIVWMDTLNGKHMPMNSSASPRDHRDGIEVFAAGDAHWASCPARARFDKRSRANAY